MQARQRALLPIVFNAGNPFLVKGAALGGITMLAGFEIDVTQAPAPGSRV